MHIFGCQSRKNKVGLLIAQLGTPDAPTKQALRPYLKEFLSDPRVIEKPRWLWWLILNGIILNTRPKRSAALYKRIWGEDGSPLLVYTQKLVEKLSNAMPDLEVGFGMRYGSHNIEEGINDLMKRGCQRILVFNMYPQYSGTTTASNVDAVFAALKKLRWQPTIKFVEPYYNHPAFIEAWVYLINEHYKTYAVRPDKLVLSYHGVPYEYIKKGDPYCCMCNVTTRSLVQQLEFPEDEIVHTFQSRFGRDPWLEPYTDETIRALPEKSIKNIAVACPGFTTDCLETLDEIGNEVREDFAEHGGGDLHLIPCLNDHPVWVDAIQKIIELDLCAWEEQDKVETYAGFKCYAAG